MNQYASDIHRFVDEWLRANGTNWEGLRKQAGVSAPVGTDIRRGSTPRPETLRKLADAMDVPLRTLYVLAGYIDADEFDSDEIDITDPEISLFFRQYEWDEFNDEEKEVVRQAIRMATAYREARRSREQQPELETNAEERAPRR